MDRTTCVLGLAAFLLGLMGVAGAHRPEATAPRRFFLALLALCTLSAVAFDLKLGLQVWRPSQLPFGHHDVFHYYFGAKYLPEVRYDGFYAATWVALDELRQEGHPGFVVNASASRDLTDLHTLFPVALLSKRGGPEAKLRFTPRRWERFKNDLLDFTQKTGYAFWGALDDRGYNGTPALSMVLAFFALIVPAGDASALPLLDAFLLAVSFVLLWRTFDPGSAMAVYLFLFSIRFSSFTWFYAVFLRMLPFALVAGMLCALHRGRFRLAGALGGMVTALNLTPVTYVAGAFAYLCLHRRYRHAVELAGSAAVTAISLVALTSLIYGPGIWPEFLAHIKPLSSCLCLNNFGFDRLLSPAEATCQASMASVNGILLPWRALGGVFILLLLAGFRRVTLVPFTAIFASSYVFFFSHPLSYYSYFFSFLVLALARPTAHEGETEVTSTSLLLALAVFPAAFLVIGALEPEHRFPFAWLRGFNAILFATYGGLALYFFLREPRGLRAHLGRLVPLGMMMTIPPLLLGRLSIPPPSELTKGAAWVDFSGQTPLRLENLVMEDQPMGGFGGSWFLGGQAFFHAIDPGGPGTVSFLVLRPAGEIDLSLIYTAASDYGPVVLEITARDESHIARHELATTAEAVEARTLEIVLPASGEPMVMSFTLPPGPPGRARFGIDHVLMTPRGGGTANVP